MNATHLNEDELVGHLKHSSLPSILVEGGDDVLIYNWIEQDLGGVGCEILPCHGRETVLNVFKRRGEFCRTPVLFVADRDLWVFTNIPDKYSDVVFTTGYSIENDLYYGRGIESYLSQEEKAKFKAAMQQYARYYGCQVERALARQPYNLTQSPQELLDKNRGYNLKTESVKEGFNEPRKELLNRIVDDYDTLLRGHSLFQLLNLFMSASGRTARHNVQGLCEICYRSHRSERIDRLIDIMKTFLKTNSPTAEA